MEFTKDELKTLKAILKTESFTTEDLIKEEEEESTKAELEDYLVEVNALLEKITQEYNKK